MIPIEVVEDRHTESYKDVIRIEDTDDKLKDIKHHLRPVNTVRPTIETSQQN